MKTPAPLPSDIYIPSHHEWLPKSKAGKSNKTSKAERGNKPSRGMMNYFVLDGFAKTDNFSLHTILDREGGQSAFDEVFRFEMGQHDLLC